MAASIASKITNDGSATLINLQTGEIYHSVNGAFTESMHVFIEFGLLHVAKEKPNQTIRILEVGFGTGLNALLTWHHQKEKKLTIDYTGFEPFLIPQDLFEETNLRLKYLLPDSLLNDFIGCYHAYLAGSDMLVNTPNFKAELKNEPWNPSAENQFDLIFYDAFSPDIEPELWDETHLQGIYNQLSTGGVMSTYCIRGAFTRFFKSVGAKTEKLPGAPGKREMLRITKI